MDRSPHPASHLSRQRVWLGGGLLALSALGVGVREAMQVDGPIGEPAVAAATDTAPDVSATVPLSAPVTLSPTTGPRPETTAVPTSTSTLPDRAPVDRTTTTTSTTTTTTTSSLAPQPPVPTSPPAPETTTPSTTPPTTEVQSLFQLPEFGAVPPEKSERLATETVRIDLGNGASCSGPMIRVDGQVAGAGSAAHCLEQLFTEVDGRTVIDHAGYINLQTGDRADSLQTIGRVAGVWLPEGLPDSMVFVLEGADPQAVKQAYEAQFATGQLQQGDVVWTSGWPAGADGAIDRRQAQPMIYIGEEPDTVVDGRRTGPQLVFAAGNNPDGTSVTEGYSGGPVVTAADEIAGTISRGVEIRREEGLFDADDLYGRKFQVDLSRPDITRLVFVQPAEPMNMNYFEVRNTNYAEVYAAEIAAITEEAHTALLDSSISKAYVNASVHLDANYHFGETISSMIEDALFHTDAAGNTLVYGRDPAAPDAGMGLMMFIPAAEEARLELRAAPGLTQATLLRQTNGVVQPVASMADYPDYLDAYGYVDQEGVSHIIGKGVLSPAPEASQSYELIVSKGQLTLVEVATDVPPVPDQ